MVKVSVEMIKVGVQSISAKDLKGSGLMFMLDFIGGVAFGRVRNIRSFWKKIYALLEKYVRDKEYQIWSEYAIPWSDVEKPLWRKADMMIEAPIRTFFIEIDIDSDPSHSIVKYWPYLEEVFQKQPDAKITLIEIWKRRSTCGKGYFELARFIGKKLEEMFQGFSCILVEISSETPEDIARQIISIIEK